MEQKAFDKIVARLKEELAPLGYTLKEDSVCRDDKGIHAYFIGEQMAYGIFYEKEQKRFNLAYCSLDNGQPEGKWHQRSVMLFDPETEEDAKNETESIIADFSDEVTEKGNQKAVLQQVVRYHQKKTSENKNNTLFFCNRMMTIFPELREETAQERITYGQIRTATFLENNILPKLRSLLQGNPPEATLKKLGKVLSEVYENGERDIASSITFVLMNQLSDDEIAKLDPFFTSEMKTGCQFSRKMRGKKLKPEKVKKQKRVVATMEDRY
ncbi:MAG: hypothetical protein LKE53_07760 [Oscillospiraceae bacterium]|nr:hypothetical protein [Oscillospiraceae bacterium]